MMVGMVARFVQVFPGEYGIPLKPWFFVLPSYWLPNRTVYGNFDVILAPLLSRFSALYAPRAPRGLPDLVP
jgi:hypothetical protein